MLYDKLVQSAHKKLTRKKKSMRPGGGGRFAALKAKLGKEPGVKNPGAIAASIGRKKFGAGQMAKWSAAGRARA